MSPRPIQETEMDTDLHHDRGLASDVSTLLERRTALRLMAGAGVAAVLAACGSSSKGSTAAASSTSSSSASSAASTSTTAAAAGTAVAKVPEETGGPFPGDGSNGPNVLTESGVVRSDIRASFGSSTTVAKGLPLTVALKIVDSATGAAKAGAAVYSSLADATAAGNPIATSQLALPKDTCDLVYATDGYSQSVRNLAQTSLARDMVFSDGAELETPIVTGSVTDGFAASLTVGV